MPSERIERAFADISRAIDLIEIWIAEAGSINVALQDVKARSAIERQLLVISEAAIRLDKIDPTFAPGHAPDIDWPGVRGIGNFIRHKYDELDMQVIADVLKHRLATLKAAVSS